MSVTGNNTPKGDPTFTSSGNSPTFAADLTAVSAYAAKVGNRQVGTTTQRNAEVTAGRVWDGLVYFDTTLWQSLEYKAGTWRWAGVEKERVVAATASGSLGAGSTVNLAPTQTIPASPFGAGVQYQVIVDGWSAASMAASNGVYFIKVQFDGAETLANHNNKIDQESGNASDVTPKVHYSAIVTAPDVTHTITVVIGALNAVATVRTSATGTNDLSGIKITLRRVDTW